MTAAQVSAILGKGWNQAAADRLTSLASAEWYTGPIVPVGTIMPAGVLDVEPYLTYNQPIGYFNAGGLRQQEHPREKTISNSTMYKWGVTDNFSIQIHTVYTYGYEKGNGFRTGALFNDFPIDLIYRFSHEHRTKYFHFPEMELFTGLVFPTGSYSNLQANGYGSGTGSYVFRTALLSQSSYLLPNNHFIRLRMWNWFFHALSTAALRNYSYYGTGSGFIGHARPGMSGEMGAAVEYHMTKKWTLNFEVVRDWSNGAHVWGRNANGLKMDRISASSGDWLISPETEWNFNGDYGLLFGVPVYFAGHNTNVEISPQFAFNMTF